MSVREATFPPYTDASLTHATHTNGPGCYSKGRNSVVELERLANSGLDFRGQSMGQSIARAVLIVVTCVIFLAYLVLTYFASDDTVDRKGVFVNETEKIKEVYITEVTPSEWSFFVWFPIWVWQFLWLLYSFTTICRTAEKGCYICNLSFMHPAIFLFFILHNLLTIGSLFLWDRDFIGWATLTFGIAQIALLVSLFVSSWQLYKNLEYLYMYRKKTDICLVRLMMQNGLAFLVAWGTIETCENVAMVMTYRWKVRQDYSATTALGIVSFLFVFWFVLENTCSYFDRLVRYTFTQYIALIVAALSIFLRHYDLDKAFRNSVFVATLLAAAAAMLVFKFIFMVWRARKRPIINEDRYDFSMSPETTLPQFESSTTFTDIEAISTEAKF